MSRTRESSILDRESRIRKLRERGAPNSSRKKFGVAYFVRIGALFALTAGLTWYAHQNTNNPFVGTPFVRAGKVGSSSFIHFRKNTSPQSHSVLFLLHGPLAPVLQALTPPSPWHLITLETDLGKIPSATLPPSSWFILYPFTAYSPPPGWPRPAACENSQSVAEVTMVTHQSEDNNRRALALTHEKLRLFVIDSVWHKNQTHAASLGKEKYDLVVIHNAVEGTALEIRNAFRPRKLVCFSNTIESGGKDRENFLWPSTRMPMYDILLSPRQELIVSPCPPPHQVSQ